MIRRYHDFDPYTAVKPMIPGVFCKECGNREENPNHRPPEPVIDWEARALAAELALTDAPTETDGHRERANSNFDEAVYAMAERDAARAETAEAGEQVHIQHARALAAEASAADLAAELAALREAVAALHPELRVGPRGLGPPWCDGCNQPYPCPTVIALASPVEPQPTEGQP